MKPYFLLALIGVGLAEPGRSQVSCPNVPVISAAVLQPTAAILVSATCSTLVVKWTGNTGQTYTVSGIRYNPATGLKDTVAGSTPVLVSGLDYQSTLAVSPGLKVTWSVQARSLINGTPYFSYPVEGTPVNYTVLACGLQPRTLAFGGKIFLQGAFSGGAMSNTLNTLGILQASASSQPYNTPGYNYAGSENAAPGFFAAHPAITDWVLVELRDSILSPTIITMRAAYLLQDGTLLDTNGTSPFIVFKNMDPGRYYVSIHHRNHLGVRTALPVNFDSAKASYDFTTSLAKAYDGAGSIGNSAMALLSTGPDVYGMFGGNANEDKATRKTGSATVNDYSLLLNAIPSLPGPTNVYRREDFNMDGNVRKTGSATTNDYSRLLSILGILNIVAEPAF